MVGSVLVQHMHYCWFLQPIVQIKVVNSQTICLPLQLKLKSVISARDK